MKDAAVIGGGAAGLAAAVFLARGAKKAGRPLSIVLLEKGGRVGRKLLATGNGTCNLSNMGASPARYHGADPAFVRPALEAFPPAAALRFFSSLGVECRVRPDGRAYPLPAQASAVLDNLRLECGALGVEERCGAAVRDIRPEKGGFVLTLPDGQLRARRVLAAAGGAASPSLGGSADGYGLLTALGHRLAPVFPSIVQVKTDTAFVRALKGIRIDGRVAFLWEGKRLAEEEGEILFTEYGLSGPAVMQISRAVSAWEQAGRRGRMEAALDLLPMMKEDALPGLLRKRRSLAGRALEEYLTGLVNKRLGQTVLRAAVLTPLSRRADSLTEGELRRLAVFLKDWRIPVLGTQGLGGAQVTAGGIAVQDFDPHTLESRKVKGLYAAGELLDVDGDCGGFNLQWAWSSAALAAKSLLASLGTAQ